MSFIEHKTPKFNLLDRVGYESIFSSDLGIERKEIITVTVTGIYIAGTTDGTVFKYIVHVDPPGAYHNGKGRVAGVPEDSLLAL